MALRSGHCPVSVTEHSNSWTQMSGVTCADTPGRGLDEAVQPLTAAELTAQATAQEPGPVAFLGQCRARGP